MGLRLLLFVWIAVGAASAAPQKKAPAKKAPGTPVVSPVDRWMTALTPRERIAQLVIIKSTGQLPPSHSRAYKDYARLVKSVGVGGIIVNNRVERRGAVNAEPFEMVAFLNRMQRLAKVPLLNGGDFERGTSMRVAGTIKYPYLMAFAATGNPDYSRYLGLATAREARALGIHWVFAPDADVNNNPQNPIINIRSYGEDPQTVSAHVRAFIAGAHSDPDARVLVTAKHFPGHGDTAVDSHVGLPTLGVAKERLQAVELVPFLAAIDAGVDSIMTAHISLPQIDPTGVPSTISKPVITGLLREELGFKGLVTTDAMDMAGLASQFPAGEAAVRALEAGVDILLIPADPDAAIEGVLKAVRSGRLKQSRIDRSVRKILAAKARLGLHTHRTVNPDNIPDSLDPEGAAAKAQEIADKAVALFRNRDNVLPLSKTAGACVLLLPERRGNANGWAFLNEMQRRAPKVPVTVLDSATPEAGLQWAVEASRNCSTIAVAAFAQLGGYRDNAALPGAFPALIKALVSTGKPVVLASLGNPYMLREFSGVAGYFTTYSPTPTSEVSAVKALFGDIPMGGQKVVTLSE